MMEQVSGMADDVFTTIWNGAESFDDAVERVRDRVGKAPRWAVLARASALRRRGVDLKHHELRGKTG